MIQKADTQHCLVFSDLDGTLLDHDTYQYDAALPSLDRLAQLGIPVILNTSKTVAEVVRLKEEMGNRDPFVAENGSIVVVPAGYFPFEPEAPFQPEGDYAIQRLGGDRKEILSLLETIRKDHGFSFTGFSQISVSQLAEMTGLPEKNAALARKRLSTEPVLWQDTARQKERFLAVLKSHGLQAVQGGRFLSVSRPFDKRDGVRVLLSLFKRRMGVPPFSIGLGDSPNDRGMLEMMDIAVIIRSASAQPFPVDRPNTVIRTDRFGPEGWHEAMTRILGLYVDRSE